MQLFLYFIVICYYFAFTNAEDTIIHVEQGALKGVTMISRNGNEYHAFLGIPFVDKPERFQAPSLDPPKKWDGVRDATEFGSPCIQFNALMNNTFGDEDCLFLNVYTPRLTAKYPVMVYIHGGGFQWGAGHIHGAKYFMDEEVVLVTLNYRIGPFGFLSTGDTVVQGNMAMKDQVAALRWVKNNIDKFGGNRDVVTIFGESAGGAAVSLQVMSPMSKGLFHRAISQSGAALNPWACLKNPRLAANELGEKLNCPTANSEDLYNCLKEKKPHELIEHSLSKWYIDPTVPFGPVVEQLQPSQSKADVFLSQTPYEIVHEGTFNRVPWITGICEDEGIYLHSAPILKDKTLVSDLNKDWHRIAPYTLTYYEDESATPEELNSISDAVKSFYFKDQEISEETRQQLTDLYSDRYFVHGVRTNAIIQARHYSPVYVYIFAYEGSFSFLQQRGFEKGYGVGHKDELQYFFDGMSPELEGQDEQLSKHVVKLWASFATSGKPTATWGTAKEWKDISVPEFIRKSPLKWYRIDSDTQVIDQPFSQRMSFWDDLSLKHAAVSVPRHVEQLYVAQQPTNNDRQEL